MSNLSAFLNAQFWLSNFSVIPVFSEMFRKVSRVFLRRSRRVAPTDVEDGVEMASAATVVVAVATAAATVAAVDDRLVMEDRQSPCLRVGDPWSDAAVSGCGEMPPVVCFPDAALVECPS